MFSCKSDFWTAGSWPLPFIMKPGLLRIQLPVHLNHFPWLFRGNWPSSGSYSICILRTWEKTKDLLHLSKKIQKHLFSASLFRSLFIRLMQNLSSLVYTLYKQDFLLKTLVKVFLEQFAFILWCKWIWGEIVTMLLLPMSQQAWPATERDLCHYYFLAYTSICPLNIHDSILPEWLNACCSFVSFKYN